MAFVPAASSGFGCSHSTSQSAICELFNVGLPRVVSHRQRLTVVACAKQTNSTLVSAEGSGTPRRRGRPRKNPGPDESRPSAGELENRAKAIPEPKRRGRSRKKAATGESTHALGRVDEYVAKQALKREDATSLNLVVSSVRSTSEKASARRKAVTTAPVVDTPAPMEQSVERRTPPPLTAAEKLVLHDTPFADRRYGECVVCGDPVAIPGLERFFCGRCGWVRRPVETETIAPGHHD